MTKHKLIVWHIPVLNIFMQYLLYFLTLKGLLCFYTCWFLAHPCSFYDPAQFYIVHNWNPYINISSDDLQYNQCVKSMRIISCKVFVELYVLAWTISLTLNTFSEQPPSQEPWATSRHHRILNKYSVNIYNISSSQNN